MRTKQEVINWLEAQIGTTVVCKGNASLNGQCVSLIKALMNFIGVPNPYATRGHAKDCINTYLSEDIAGKGVGFLSVFSNKNMGGGYGHVWCNAGDGDGTFYESNGAKPLICTKGKTYSYDNVCNFDKYIKTESTTMTDDQKGRENGNKLFAKIKGNINAKETPQDLAVWVQNDIDNVSNEINQAYKDKNGLVTDISAKNLQISELQSDLTTEKSTVTEIQKTLGTQEKLITSQVTQISTLTSQLEKKTADFEALQSSFLEEKQVLVATAKDTLDKQAKDYEKKITDLELTITQLQTNINTIKVEKDYTLKELLIKTWQKLWERI